MKKISLSRIPFLPYVFRIHTLFILLIVIAAGVAGLMYNRYQIAQRQIKSFIDNPTEVTKAEAKVITEAVGKLITLPEAETPTIATVTDLERVKDQPFFAKAENNDKVLIFTQAKKAILYRPSSNKVIEVGAVNIAQQEGPQQEQVAGVKTDQKR